MNGWLASPWNTSHYGPTISLSIKIYLEIILRETTFVSLRTNQDYEKRTLYETTAKSEFLSYLKEKLEPVSFSDLIG